MQEGKEGWSPTRPKVTYLTAATDQQGAAPKRVLKEHPAEVPRSLALKGTVAIAELSSILLREAIAIQTEPRRLPAVSFTPTRRLLSWVAMILGGFCSSHNGLLNIISL
jgi:hypothetical protein